MGKKNNIYIRKIRLDNSGENRKLQQKCDEENLGVRFEFMAPGTPQNSNRQKISWMQNGCLR